MSKGDLLTKINIGRKKLLIESDIFSDTIKISLLKKIDSIFKQGLSFYIDPTNITTSNFNSIFFRKDNFNADLNLEARLTVNKYEEEKIAFSTLAKLSDFKLNRKVAIYNLSDDPKKVSDEVRKLLYPKFDKTNKKFLSNFISVLADNNILVFEFVEHPQKIEKANINGFYLTPNVIVLKRNQKSFNREIFTLAHELGHYILDKEEIDENVQEESSTPSNLNAIERWCNDFAFYFLVSDFNDAIDVLEYATAMNDYHYDIIKDISEKTHLSTIALYTRLLLQNKISPYNYKLVTSDIREKIKAREDAERIKLELEKQKALLEGKKPMGSIAKPIISPLYLQTLQSALHTGLLNEADFCNKLNIKPNQLDKYLI